MGQELSTSAGDFPSLLIGQPLWNHRFLLGQCFLKVFFRASVFFGFCQAFCFYLPAKLEHKLTSWRVFSGPRVLISNRTDETFQYQAKVKRMHMIQFELVCHVGHKMTFEKSSFLYYFFPEI